MSTPILRPIAIALRSRIVRALGASAALSAACGGRLSVDLVDGSIGSGGDPAGSSTTGSMTSGTTGTSTSGGAGGRDTTGVGGTGGSTATTMTTTMGMASTTMTSGPAGAGGRPTGGSGGVAGTGGSGGTTGAGGASIKVYNCFKAEQVRTMCTNGTHTCLTEGGTWNPDGGFYCPDRMLINLQCQSFDGLITKAGGCCYLVPGPPNPACGRPFLVQGTARRAAATTRADWLADEPSPDDLDLDPITRGALARAWLEDARSEHASIASFARFTLELLAWGAPSGLVAEAQRAAADEIDHARHCFWLASRYAAQSMGPGSLSIDGPMFASSLAAAAAATVREGCVGETIGAVQASHQHAQAADPRVRAVLAVVADDEARHAELAWRFVAWAVSVGGDKVREAVGRAFEEALAEVRALAHDAPLAVDAFAWRAHGRLSADEQRTSTFDAIEHVVEPCRRALAEAAVLPAADEVALSV